MSVRQRKSGAQRKRRVAHAGPHKKIRAKNSKQHAARAPTKRKEGRLRGTPTNHLTAFVKASGQLLGLPIEPEWEAAVTANLATILRLASAFADFPLPDEAESAPVFTA